jgi:UDP-glucuronate 4-epimerase
MNILVTGTAGFIGHKIVEKLLANHHHVLGIDNLNDYYDPILKKWRIEQLNSFKHFHFKQVDIESIDELKEILKYFKPEVMINEAARAGVRYSLENPDVYFFTNVIGTLHLLKLCKLYDVKKFILASTSSLYAGQEGPFSEENDVSKPISPYAASKKSAEVLSYTYHYLYGLDVTVLRYFTVYGPAGRPDMSPFRFIKWVLEEKPIIIYGDGNQERDFTYIDDIAEGTVRAINPKNYEIINLGSGVPYRLMEMISLIEKYTGKKARLEFKESQKADMKKTWADIEKAKKLLNWEPAVNFEEGIKRTVKWTIDNWEWVQKISL